jgi:hypothetical protein
MSARHRAVVHKVEGRRARPVERDAQERKPLWRVVRSRLPEGRTLFYAGRALSGP